MSKNGNTIDPGRILDAALKKEQAAYRFYDAMLKRTNVEFMRELLEDLRNEESQHIRRVRNKISKFRAGHGM